MKAFAVGILLLVSVRCAWSQKSHIEVVGDSVRIMHATNGVPIVDTVHFRSTSARILQVGPIEWWTSITDDYLGGSEPVVLISLTQSALAHHSKLRNLTDVIFLVQDAEGTKWRDTVVLDIRYSSIDTDRSFTWSETTLPTDALPEKSRLTSSSGALIPLTMRNFESTSNFGQSWTLLNGPATEVSSVVRLPNGNLVATTTDHKLFASSSSCDAWSEVTNLDRYRPSQDPTASPVTVGNVYQVALHDALVYCSYSDSGRQYAFTIKTADGVNWEFARSHAPALVLAVDSLGLLIPADSADLSGGSTIPRVEPTLTVEQRGRYPTYGMRQFGVYRSRLSVRNFTDGDIYHLALTARSDLFASDGKTLWHFDSLGDWWLIPLPDSTEPLRNVFIDQEDHVNVLTATTWYRSRVAYAAVREDHAFAGGSLEVTPLKWQGSELNFELRGDLAGAELRLVDAIGRTIAARTLTAGDAGSSRATLDVPNVAHGQYFLALQSRSGSRIVGITH